MGVETDEFAAMLRELKERSGRSYGALATRLHVSTSTLHRYCNGAAVPAEYAPVERLARACGARDEELVELHRRWILADAARRREAGAAGTATAQAATAKPEPAPAPQPASAPVPVPANTNAPANAPAEEVEPVRPVDPSVEPRRRTRTRVLLSAVAVAALAALVSVFVLREGGGATDTTTSPTAAAAPTPVSGPAATTPATAPAAAPPDATGSPTAGSPAAASPTSSPSPEENTAPFHVNVLADNWGSPCGQWFLSSRTPSQVAPPPDSAARTGSWAAGQHAVPAGHLRLELTALGKNPTPVVLNDVYVHIVSTQPAPKWNAYTPGAGCGGALVPASFAVDLDSPSPHAVPVAGREGTKKTPVTDFPYRVSDTDPQVIDVDATTLSQDVTWYLELKWNSGLSHGTLRVDDNGRPFRTVGLRGAPGYFYNGKAWAPSPVDG
ncbi:helix-turn-helix domain-containing protein [Streptomyces sp. 1331.2]|uniref:helix-turn-helix domain-containing protein n=1 Tax=Streptomyces sp. 1331.2 TaxID=1938835 RepID=UPI000BD79338|nr:helix-turn-helix transcriptional regulator [Streptomyces sp. 1331.2]SOB81205.1 Helix-turn-helix domain-containing protein [Streptomyces sp. 1331.2]